MCLQFFLCNCMLFCCLLSYAQDSDPKDDWQPAVTSQNGKEYPHVNSEGRVKFSSGTITTDDVNNTEVFKEKVQLVFVSFGSKKVDGEGSRSDSDARRSETSASFNGSAVRSSHRSYH